MVERTLDLKKAGRIQPINKDLKNPLKSGRESKKSTTAAPDLETLPLIDTHDVGEGTVATRRKRIRREDYYCKTRETGVNSPITKGPRLGGGEAQEAGHMLAESQAAQEPHCSANKTENSEFWGTT